MNHTSRRLVRRAGRSALAALCVIAIGRGDASASVLMARPSAAQAPAEANTPSIPADQLDALVAPIALYPDPLLAQTLAASTYPLELMQLQQWLTKNSGLTGKALADAVAKQPWDPSIQSMAALPDVVKRLADDIQWTTDLGNAFLAQESDVMSAVQRMRQKAKDTGNLKSTQQQVVETRVIENKEVIVIEQSNPQVVYVPSVQPHCGLWTAGLSLSADLLSVRRSLCSRRGDFVRRWGGDGRVLGWWWLGLERRLGPWRHQCQPQRQLQSKFEHQPHRAISTTHGSTTPRIGAELRIVIVPLPTATAAPRAATR